MAKKFLFINLSINCGFTGVNHGIAYLVPILKKYSYEVECLNISQQINAEEFRNIIDASNPGIIGFSCTEHQLKYLVRYSRELENYTEILQISGGAASTLDPEWILTKTAVKGVCVGEGEIPLADLLDNLDKGKNITDTRGFYWRINNTVKKAFNPAFVADLSTLDFPDYTVFEKDLVSYDGHINIMLSRGCPYSCYHCCNAALREVYSSPRGYFRLPSVNYSIALLEKMVRLYPETNFIGFEDDLLIADKNWFREFSDEYRKKINMPYRVCVRVECITQDIVKMLKDSRCKQVSLGVESGSERVRSEVLNRKYGNRLLLEKSKLLKNAGLDLFTFNIVGFPFEDRKEMKETYELNRQIAPSSGTCFFFYPYKGTKLYSMCVHANLLKNKSERMEITNYCSRPSISMSVVHEKDCMHYQKKIWRYLEKQECLFKISQLSHGVKKYPLAVVYWLRSILRTRPFWERIVRRISGLLGVKTFIKKFVEIKVEE